MSVYSNEFNVEIDLNNTGSTHTKVINLVGHNKTVLEVGCSSGYMAKILKENFGCKVFGLEIDPEDAKKAEQYCEKVVVGNIETIDLSEYFQEKQFDVIILADVLEHLNNPQAVLEKLHPYLKGFLAISIPNIAHSSVIYDLIDGKFEYTAMGLLDETHKRFFTKDSFKKLLAKTGYDLFSVDPVEVDPVLSEKRIDLNSHPQAVVDHLQGLEGINDYQYVFKAFTPNPEVALLKEEIVKIKEDKINLVNKHNELEKNYQNSLAWYKSKTKELLQINSKQSYKLNKLETKVQRLEKYSADNYPKLLAYPIKLIMLIYNCGFKEVFRYAVKKTVTKRTS